MSQNRWNRALLLAVVPLCLAASGCFVPGGGWTLRSGIDLRRKCKPSAFVELVDTKWDEYNLVEEMNVYGAYGDQGVPFIPGSPPADLGPMPPPSPTSSSTPLRTNPLNGLAPPPAADGHEPSLLPGTAEDASDGPQTAQQSPLEGPQLPVTSGASYDGVPPISKSARRPIASRLFARP